MSEWLLEARELHTYYGASHVLHGVDFRIDAGEAVGLMGRNGMGKSTLIRSMLGLVKPRHGEVRVRGTPMTGADPFRVARQGIAYVPEGRGIFPNLTVRENLVMAARAGPDGRRDWTYERALATFPRLAERLDHGGGQLSGGEQQMLTIGRALMTNPDLLILDEATEGLAPLIAREIWRIVGEIRAHGIATLIVDKNYRAVTAITDRNVILVKGRVVFEGDSRSTARAAGRAAPASRGLAGCRHAVRQRRVAAPRVSAHRHCAPGAADARLPPRGTGLGRDVARLSRRASPARRSSAPSSIRASGTASPSRCAEPRTARYLHDEAEIVLPEFLDRLEIERPILDRAQRRRLDRADLCGDRGAAAARRSLRSPPTCWSKTSRSRALLPPGKSSRRRTFARSSRAIMPTSIRSSGDGIASGFRRSSARGTSRNTCRESGARCSRSRARTTNTAQWNRCGGSAPRSATSELLKLPNCRHSAHKDQPDAVIDAIARFVASVDA